MLRLTLKGGLSTALALAILAVLIPGQSSATVLTEAETASTLTITGFKDAATGDLISKPLDLVLDGFAFIDADFTDATGLGVATTGGFADVLAAFPFDMDVGDAIDLSAEASTSSEAPPLSTATAAFLASGGIFIDNFFGTEAVIVELSFDYSLFASVAFDDPATEDGLAFSSILLIATDFFGTADELVDEFVEASVGGGGGPIPVVGTLDFEVLVGAGEFADVTVFLNDSVGDSFANNPIPEPMSAAIWSIIGALGMAVAYRRRRKSARRQATDG